MSHKGWYTLYGTTAQCQYCGAASVWSPEVGTEHDPDESHRGYWEWWREFQRDHAHPEGTDLDGPWFK